MYLVINGKKRSLKRVCLMAIVLVMIIGEVVFNPEIGYETVTVQQNDTLESIIIDNTDIPWRGNIQNLMIKTKEVNSADLDVLYPGEKIVIAVYKK